MFSKRDRETICSGFEMDPYHELACIFGEAYNSFAVTKSFKTCGIYIPKSKTKGNNFYAGWSFIISRSFKNRKRSH